MQLPARGGVALGEDGPVAQMAATTGTDMVTYTRQYPAISD
jgi:hypothetical protein